jgi:nitrous oxidase accessory protein NosD
MEGTSGRIVDNDVLNVRGNGYTYGLYLTGADNMIIENNRIDTVYSFTEEGTAIFVSGSYGVLIRGTSITSATRAIMWVASSGKFRDTQTTGVTNPYSGGTDGGGND